MYSCICCSFRKVRHFVNEGDCGFRPKGKWEVSRGCHSLSHLNVWMLLECFYKIYSIGESDYLINLPISNSKNLRPKMSIPFVPTVYCDHHCFTLYHSRSTLCHDGYPKRPCVVVPVLRDLFSQDTALKRG